MTITAQEIAEKYSPEVIQDVLNLIQGMEEKKSEPDTSPQNAKMVSFEVDEWWKADSPLKNYV